MLHSVSEKGGGGCWQRAVESRHSTSSLISNMATSSQTGNECLQYVNYLPESHSFSDINQVVVVALT